MWCVCLPPEGYKREKRILLEQVVDLKKENNLLDSNGVRRDGQLLQTRDELDKTTLLLKNTENKIRMLESQVSINLSLIDTGTLYSDKELLWENLLLN